MELFIILVFTIIVLIYLFILIIVDDKKEELLARFLFLYLFLILLLLISYVTKPKAIDVYKGKTTLEITYKDKVPIDSTVVWKNK